MGRPLMSEADARFLSMQADERCSTCRMSWWLFPPVKIDGEDKVRCIECKDVFESHSCVRCVVDRMYNSPQRRRT